ncbi:homeobox protein 2 [Condylostylus longicornis]|uniref:homeobox protein 2 n=1 Tax=Condylostylus longicornis TaxID=2530218 RepID=UPI00244E3486|nr:homeobox protein 2 [Condylostylus longicornis]
MAKYSRHHSGVNDGFNSTDSTTLSNQQQFCVRWNSHLDSLGAAFPQLLANQRFVDCTLACEGHQLHCHRLVLAACSSYFESLLGDNPCKHPIVILSRDIKLWELQALIDFMYKGEVNVSQAGLSDLLKCAEILQIRGLSGIDNSFNLNQIKIDSTAQQQNYQQQQQQINLINNKKLQCNERNINDKVIIKDNEMNIIVPTLLSTKTSTTNSITSCIASLTGTTSSSLSPLSSTTQNQVNDELIASNSSASALSVSPTTNIRLSSSSSSSTSSSSTTTNLQMPKNNVQNSFPSYDTLKFSVYNDEDNLFACLVCLFKDYGDNEYESNNNNSKNKKNTSQNSYSHNVNDYTKSNNINKTIKTAENTRDNNNIENNIVLDVNENNSNSNSNNNSKNNNSNCNNDNEKSSLENSFNLAVAAIIAAATASSSSPTPPSSFVSNNRNDNLDQNSLSKINSNNNNNNDNDDDNNIKNISKYKEDDNFNIIINSNENNNYKNNRSNSSNINDNNNDTDLTKNLIPKVEPMEINTLNDETDDNSLYYSKTDGDFSDFMDTNIKSPDDVCDYDESILRFNIENLPVGRKVRRSEAILRQAAECVSKGQTFQTVSDIFNIPISTIRFFMARKGILPRRKRGRQTTTTTNVITTAAAILLTSATTIESATIVPQSSLSTTTTTISPISTTTAANNSNNSNGEINNIKIDNIIDYDDKLTTDSPTQQVPFYFGNYKLPEIKPKLIISP